MRSICAAFVLACAAHSGAAFTTTGTGTARTASAQASSALSATNAHGEGLDRRGLFGKVAAAATVSTGIGFPFPAFAAGGPPTEAEIQRIKTG